MASTFVFAKENTREALISAIKEEYSLAVDTISKEFRLEQMTEEEKKTFEEMLLMSFPVVEVELEDGTKKQYFVIELVIEQNGVSHVERYGFLFDEESESWIFDKLEADVAINEMN